jgi:hypothetical protein
MSILTDALIDAKADLCWNHQQQQLKKEIKTDCICAQLADMIYLTRKEIAKMIEAIHIADIDNVKPLHLAQGVQSMAASIARGKNNG